MITVAGEGLLRFPGIAGNRVSRVAADVALVVECRLHRLPSGDGDETLHATA